ncbi:hypothetical protein CUMW_177860 [Citrus unshiu]|uniref:Uncharacterized protein n=1 Tax=Citrus unshiu TaxID=55188 RepID=A0A2H5PY11_CITUN|nr:hypothetical protein CUMW_177860 [Citrus unshiu]
MRFDELLSIVYRLSFSVGACHNHQSPNGKSFNTSWPRGDCMRKTQTQISLGDVGNEEHAYRKIRLRAEDVQEKNVLTPSKGRIF